MYHQQCPQISVDLQQQQKLILTPEIRQAIEILQMPAAELAVYARQQAEENPFLEVDEDGFLEGAETLAEWLLPRGNERNEEEGSVAEEDGYYETPLPVTLREHLLWQLRLTAETEAEYEIGQAVIDSLDEKGYFPFLPSELAAALGFKIEEVERALEMVRGFDPPGVAAADLRECLELQLNRLLPNSAAEGRGERNREACEEPVSSRDGGTGRWETLRLARQVVRCYLEEVARGSIRTIADRTGSSPQQVQKAVDVIKSLEPRPARGFAGNLRNFYIVPDLTVRQIEGKMVVLANESSVPSIRLSLYYQRMVEKNAGELSEGAREYLEQKLKAAVWFVRSIEQRRRTIRKVMEAIIEFQPDFFREGREFGPKKLRPMTLQDIAARVGVHESTVSRATAGKFVQTSHGLFELRSFFSGGYNRPEGGGVSSQVVKDLLGELVAGEEPSNPRSDSSLVEEMARHGIQISRRTVAKYRQELRIGSSRRRKRY